MSSSTSFPAAEEIKFLTRRYTANYFLVAATALVVYEHIITFDCEVLAIWRYRMTGATILLLLNRCVLLLSAITNAFVVSTWTSDQISICEAQFVLSDVTYVLSPVITAALRVYAIAGQNWYWSLLALLTGLVPAVGNAYLYISESHPYVVYLFGIPQCLGTTSLSDSFFDRLLIATGICATVSDLVVVVVTWLYARPWAKHVLDTRIKTPLMVVIVRDGTGYFIVLLILNIVQMVTVQWSYSEAADFYLDYISVFTPIPVISAILISRFMFNLRQYIDQRDSTGSNDPSFVARGMGSRGSIEFGSRLVGNMGAPLDHIIPDSLLFDDSDEPHEDIGCNEEIDYMSHIMLI